VGGKDIQIFFSIPTETIEKRKAKGEKRIANSSQQAFGLLVRIH